MFTGMQMGQSGVCENLESRRLLSASLQKGVGFDLLETDKDLDPIRNSPEFQRLVDAARAIRATMTVPPPKTGV